MKLSPLEYFKMHIAIDMNNQPIINLGDPAGFKDAVSRSSLSSIIKNSYIFRTVKKAHLFVMEGHTTVMLLFVVLQKSILIL